MVAHMKARGHNYDSADAHGDALMLHACVLRTKADAQSPAFRVFAVRAAKYSRQGRHVRWLAKLDPNGVLPLSCEALHDLIMEGVQ